MIVPSILQCRQSIKILIASVTSLVPRPTLLPESSVSSTSTLSLLIVFLAGPCAVELMTSSVSLSPTLEPSANCYKYFCTAHLHLINTSTSVNLQFAKLERRIYGPCPRPGMRMRNRMFRIYVRRASLGI